MRYVLALVALLGVFGCNSGDQRQIVDETRSAYAATNKSLSAAWDSLNDQARHIDLNSSKTDIEEMKSRLRSLRAQATRESKAQVEAAQDQWKRLDLAAKVKDLQTETAAKLDAMNKARTEASKDLEETNKAYAAAQEKLAEAQKAYDEATKRADDAWNALSGH